MAKQIVHKLIDDIDGGDAEETVRFGMDGVAYEIDLSEKNASDLRNVLAPYVKAGSKVGRGGVAVAGRGGRGTATVTSRRENKIIRAWAEKNGKDVADRGRIPQKIVDEYYATR